jgi:hypothetical protein
MESQAAAAGRLRLRHLAANLNWRALFEGLARRPQPLAEPKRPNGAELDRWSVRVSRVDQDIV